MVVHVDAYQAGDVDRLMPVLNPACRDEIMALGLDPVWAIRRTAAASEEAWTGYVNDELVGLFGVVASGVLAPVYRPWFVGADYLAEHSRQFAPLSRRAVRSWARKYQSLENFVDTRHLVAIRWLEWLGFEIHPAAPHGSYARPFHRFTMEAPDVR